MMAIGSVLRLDDLHMLAMCTEGKQQIDERAAHGAEAR